MSDTTFVGLDPFEPGFFDDPYPQYGRIREHDPVHRSPLGLWFLSRYDDVVGLLRAQGLSVERERATATTLTEVSPEVADRRAERRDRAMLNIDPPDHTRLRRLVSKAFTPRMMEGLRPRVQELVDDALDGIETRARDGATVDLIAELAFPLPFQVITGLLGMPDGDRAQLRSWSHTITKGLEPLMSADEVPDLLAASDQMGAHVMDAIAHKRAHPADDLLSRLIAAEDEGDVLDTEELVAQVVLLYLAGHETTVNLIGNGTLALLRNRDQLERLQADPGLDQAATEELLRYDSPVQFSRRVTTREVEVGGTTIPTGSLVMTGLGAANHDPDHFGADADRLVLDRPNAAHHVSFGSGVHHCLGAALARVEAQVAIGTLVRRFGDIERATDEPAWNGRLVLRGLDELPVSLGLTA